MKNIYLFAIGLIISFQAISQAPQKISYQAVIRNASGVLVSNTAIGLKTSILQGSTTGTVVYAETQTLSTNANGLISMQIGTGTISAGSMTTINWANGPYFIKTETDLAGGTNYTIVSITELLSVPYAIYANNGISTEEKTKLQNTSGTNTGDQDLSTLATKTSLSSGMALKVDKVTGKGLSTNDYTTAEKTKLTAITGTNTGDQDLSKLATTSSVNTSLDLKVDKVTGKGLSSNDYTTAEKTKLTAITGTNTGDQDLSKLATTTSVNTSLDLKVDKVTGKGLSTNDYTTAEKTKLTAITGTNTGDQDLSKLATTSSVNTSLDLKVDKVTGKGLSTNDYTTAEKTKLTAITGTNTGDQDLSNLVVKETGKGLEANGTAAGQMKYWNGTTWVTVAPGTYGQTLTMCDNVPTWGPCKATLTTTAVSSIIGKTATTGGSITYDGGITDRGVCYSTTSNPTIVNSKVAGAASSNYTCTLTKLSLATTYYVRAYATSGTGTSYGNEVSFKTASVVNITLTTTAATSITKTTATVEGNISSDGGDEVIARGVVYGTTTNPTLANNVLTSGAGTGSFSCSLSGLTRGTKYYARAYATNSIGTTYGNEVSFTTELVVIGEKYAGGRVAYIDATRMHGFVVDSLSYTGGGWGCVGTNISGAVGTAIGTGNQNTLDIIASCTTSSAAKICADLTTNGYTDWYLPSILELREITNNYSLFGYGIQIDPGDTGIFYSSSQDSTDPSLVLVIKGPNQPTSKVDKAYRASSTITYLARAIRSF